MSVSYKDFFAIGLATLNSSNSEIAWRNVASRIYYAAYHQANTIAHNFEDQNFNKRMGDHERLAARFLDHEKMGPVRSIGVALEGMKKLRHKADYGVNNDFPKMYAEMQIATYKLLNEKISALEESLQ